MEKEQDNSYHKMNLNCEEWANAKPYRKVEKSVFII